MPIFLLLSWLLFSALSPVISPLLGQPGRLGAPVGLPRLNANIVLPTFEHIDYRVKLGRLPVGHATLRLRPDSLDGVPLARATFALSGGLAFFKVRDRYNSWFDPKTFTSLRYSQEIHQGSYRRTSIYKYNLNDTTFKENDGPPKPSVAHPIDEASFLYLIRALSFDNGPLAVRRYFKPDRNPIWLTLVGRDTLNTAIGRVPVLILEPRIEATGLFADKSRSKIWLTDDHRRLLVRLQSSPSVGTMTLEITSYKSQ